MKMIWFFIFTCGDNIADKKICYMSLRRIDFMFK